MASQDLVQDILESIQTAPDLDGLLAALRDRHGAAPAADVAAALRGAADEIDRTLARGGRPTSESARARAHADAVDARIARIGGTPTLARIA